MQQIEDWLNELGMSEYTPRFARGSPIFTVGGVDDATLKDAA
jgi:hypothetical protein